LRFSESVWLRRGRAGKSRGLVAKPFTQKPEHALSLVQRLLLAEPICAAGGVRRTCAVTGTQVFCNY